MIQAPPLRCCWTDATTSCEMQTADRCPICKTALVDQCCATCGSLEGVDEDCFAAS